MKRPIILAENCLFHREGCEGRIIVDGLRYCPLPEETNCNSAIECGTYFKNEPFGVIRTSKAENELRVCEKISAYLEGLGFYTVYDTVGLGEFKNLFFEGNETACIALEIPSIGNDLRLNEFRRLANYYKSEPEKLFEVAKKIAEWNGASAKMHNDLCISPLDRSLGPDNYILTKVSKDGIG
jgi:hypothetical protein